MTELQTSEVVEGVEESINPVEGTTPEAAKNSESATETQPEESGNVQKRINKITAEKYALARKVEEMEKKLSSAQPSVAGSATPQSDSSPELEVPKLPDDLYDEEAMKKYHADTLKYSQEVSRREAASAAKTHFEQQQEQAKQAIIQAETQKLIQGYAERGLQAGISHDQMVLNEQSLVQNGVNSDLGRFLMEDPLGPQLTAYLAENLDKFHEINAMTPYAAGAMIENEIKKNVLGPRNVTTAPDPVAGINGGSGAKESDEFDKLCPGAQFD
jgi:hypothetical protein